MNLQTTNSNPTTNQNELDFLPIMLKESIDRFLSQFRKGTTDFSCFSSMFSRLLHNLPDPSLETVWFYSAVTFYSRNHDVRDSSDEISASNYLLRLLFEYRSSLISVERIAIFAPLVYRLGRLSWSVSMENKKEIEYLLELIANFINISCAVEPKEDNGLSALSSSFGDLIRVWIVDKVDEEDMNMGQCLTIFLPLVSNGVRQRIVSGCGVGYLAGAVICETFLLTLCLKFGSWMSKPEELKKVLKDCAVEMVTKFQNIHFIDILLKILLEPVLPVASVLDSEDEALLREVLNDVVITVDYSFFKPERGLLLPSKHLKNLAMTWLFVVDNAIRCARECENQTKVITYQNTFSKSYLPSCLVDCVIQQDGLMIEESCLNISPVEGLVKWLLALEDQGFKILDCDILKVHAKTVISYTNKNTFLHSNGEQKGENTINNNDDDDDNEMLCMDNTSCMFPNSISATVLGSKKRKEWWKHEGETPIKIYKSDHYENLVRNKTLHFTRDDCLSSGSEVDNPISDEDIVNMEE